MKTTKALFGILTLTTVLAVHAQAQSFLTNGLVAYYPFNGNGNDASGNGYNVTNSSIPLTADRFFRPNAATVLSQTMFAPNLIFAASSAPRTLSEWVELKDYPGNTTAGWGPKANASFVNFLGSTIPYCNLASDGEFWLDTGFGGVAFFQMPTPTKWSHVVIVYSGGIDTAQVYFNGQLLPLKRTSNSGPGFAYPSQNYSALISPNGPGLSGFSTNNFVDDIRIYNRALTSNEVAQLYAIESAPTKFQLINGSFSSWAAANADAISRGGHLATFTSAQEWQQFTDTVGTAAIGSNAWWLGASDVQQEGVWKWTTGETWSYTRWAPGEPSGFGVNGEEDYLVLENNGTWNDAASTIQISIGYVLEFEPEGALVKAVKPAFTKLSLGANYQLQVSTDLNTWTNYGAIFTATNSTWRSTNYWDVDNWNQLFFRLQLAP